MGDEGLEEEMSKMDRSGGRSRKRKRERDPWLRKKKKNYGPSGGENAKGTDFGQKRAMERYGYASQSGGRE